jgi:tRNA A-37 threonylcarbamoyl transferase component Bud32
MTEKERQGDPPSPKGGYGVASPPSPRGGYGVASPASPWRELLAALSERGLDSVDGAFPYGEGQDLEKPGLEHRRRTRLEITGANDTVHELYLKRYEDEGFWRKVCRRLIYGRGKSPGTCEFDNIRAVGAAGVPTMQEIICGQQGGLLSRCRSYIIVTAVPGRSLEKCASELLAADPAAGPALAVKLGRLAAALHGHGFVHRDFYACHIFVNGSAGHGMDLYLIDLARVFKPRWRKFRWRVKDLAQLRYSMPMHWVNEHWGPLLDSYLNAFEEHCPVRTGCKHRGSGTRDADRLGRDIDAKVAWMVGRAARRAAGGSLA